MRAFVLALLFFPMSGAWARTSHMWQKGMVPISATRSLYVEYRPAAPGQPTLVLLNGLTYTTQQWASFVDALDRDNPGLGLVLYDMQGMGQTLLHRLPVNYDVSIPDQIADLHKLLSVLDIPGRKILSGLSYGGAVTLGYAARYPNDFETYVAMSPYLQRLKDQDQIIKNWVAWHRVSFPLDPRTDQELYDYYLRQIVYSTYPSLEPNVLASPFYLEGVFRLAKGAENWVTADIAPQLPAGKIHIMGGALDPYVPKADLQRFWTLVPASARASFVMLQNTSHKISEDQSAFTAGWLMKILDGDPRLQEGLNFTANPVTGVAQSGDVEVDIPVKGGMNCESLLRRTSSTRQFGSFIFAW